MKNIDFFVAVLFCAAEWFSAQPLPRAAVAGHTHLCRNGKVGFDVVMSNLTAWIEKHDVRAFGVGSPWTPKQAARMRRCEREDRDCYFAGKIEEELTDTPNLYAMLAVLSNACPRTTFYLDNETPKNRYGHLWFMGYKPVVTGWHDYSQDRRVAFTTDEAEAAGPDLNKETGRSHLRRSYAEAVAEQRRHGALAVWAHPTSWWTHKGKFITNIAADMSSGPDLRILSFDDSGETIKIGIYAAPKPGERMFSRIEILGRGGKVRAVVENAAEGEYLISVSRKTGDTCFVARCFG